MRLWNLEPPLFYNISMWLIGAVLVLVQFFSAQLLQCSDGLGCVVIIIPFLIILALPGFIFGLLLQSKISLLDRLLAIVEIQFIVYFLSLVAYSLFNYYAGLENLDITSILLYTAIATFSAVITFPIGASIKKLLFLRRSQRYRMKE